jgi:hypothetical protein
MSDHLGFQVGDHITDGAIFWKSDAMNYNLANRVH